MRPVEAVGHPQNGGELGYLLLHLFGCLRKLRMALLRRRLPMVARDESDDLDLLLREAAHVVRHDEVLSVTMVPITGDVKTDVVEDRRVLEKEAVGVGEAVQLAGLVEDRKSEPGHVMRMGLRVVASASELHDAAAALIGKLVDELDARAFFAM